MEILNNIISYFSVVILSVIFSRFIFVNPLSIFYILLIIYSITSILSFTIVSTTTTEPPTILEVLQEKEGDETSSQITSSSKISNRVDNDKKYRILKRKFNKVQKELTETKIEIENMKNSLLKEKFEKTTDTNDDTQDYIDDFIPDVPEDIPENEIDDMLSDAMKNVIDFEFIE